MQSTTENNLVGLTQGWATSVLEAEGHHCLTEFSSNLEKKKKNHLPVTFNSEDLD